MGPDFCHHVEFRVRWRSRHEVGIGAILGAPPHARHARLCPHGRIRSKKNEVGLGPFQPEMTGLTRDLTWFNYVFALGVIAALVPQDSTFDPRKYQSLARHVIWTVFIGHHSRLIKSGGRWGMPTEADHPLYLSKIGLPTHLLVIFVPVGCWIHLYHVGRKGGSFHGVEHLAACLRNFGFGTVIF